MDNFLLQDYLNLEQDVYWKIMIVQTMIQDKQDWIEIKRALRDITSNYIELYQLNQILWCITEGDEKLTDFLEKKDKIDELRLIHETKETLKKCEFTIIYDQCIEAEICQAKQELTEYIDIDFDSMNIQEEEILHKDRKDQIQKAFKYDNVY